VPVVKPAFGPGSHGIGVGSGWRPRPTPGTFFSNLRSAHRAVCLAAYAVLVAAMALAAAALPPAVP
jgi:hypothetical protein